MGKDNKKKSVYVEANVMNMHAKFQLHSPYSFWGYPLRCHGNQSNIKLSDLDKILMNSKGLLKKHFCKKKNLNICSETAKTANFHFSHYQPMETKFP